MRAITDFRSSGRVSAGCTRLRGDHAGDIYRPDGLPVWTLNYTLEGVGRIDGPGLHFLSQVGDFLLIGPGVLNDYGIDDEHRLWTHLWATFHPDEAWHALLDWPPLERGILHLRLTKAEFLEQLVRLFQDLIAVVHSPFVQRQEIAAHLLHALLLWCDAANPRSTRSRLDPRIQAALAHLCAHLDRRTDIDTMAAVAGLSASRFAHLFRDQTGLPPLQYLERERVARASDLLLMTGKPVAVVAAEVGIDDPSYFSRIFRRQTGRTPREFRHQPGR